MFMRRLRLLGFTRFDSRHDVIITIDDHHHVLLKINTSVGYVYFAMRMPVLL
jgi:hypothetical protein